MVTATAYKEHLNPNRLDSGEKLGYKELQASVKYPIHTDLARYGRNDDESTDIVFYTDGRISRLRKRYEFRGGAAIENFLEDHSFLIQPLSEAYRRIREYFGPKARLALKVVNDPEAQQDPELFVFIQTGLRPRAARTLLAELDRDWWREAFPNTRGKLTIGLEYV